jgi:hypothetical protein
MDSAPQPAKPHGSNLVEALSIIGDARWQDIYIERAPDGRICWRGADPSPELLARMKANAPALAELLAHRALQVEQRAVHLMAADAMELDDAFGLAASERGMAGGVEYGRQIAGRSRAH